VKFHHESGSLIHATPRLSDFLKRSNICPQCLQLQRTSYSRFLLVSFSFVAFMILFSDVQSDVVSKYTFLKQRIKPTGQTVEERELEAALAELLQAAGCPQPSIREMGSGCSFSAVTAVRSCQDHVRQQLQVCTRLLPPHPLQTSVGW
jgi:hypothetical protein